MADHSELKKLAEAAPEGPWFGPEYAPGTSYVFDVDLGTLLHYESIESEQDACLRYVAAANPGAVLALIAENERLSANVKLNLCDHPAIHRADVDLLIASVSGTSQIELAKMHGCTPPNISRKIRRVKTRLGWREGMSVAEIRARADQLRGLASQGAVVAADLMAERDQLKAEIAGLKTGYEAYEQVNAGLKAEVEALRAGRQQSSRLIENLQAELGEAKQFQPIGEACLSNRDTLRASLGLKLGDHLHEHVELLRKDAERYRWLRDQCGIVEYQAIAGSIGSGMLLSGENLDAALSVAMGKGEQS